MSGQVKTKVMADDELSRVARSLFGSGSGNLRYYVLSGGTGPATTSLASTSVGCSA